MSGSTSAETAGFTFLSGAAVGTDLAEGAEGGPLGPVVGFGARAWQEFVSRLG
ncbi:hypothetical protein [Streptomyces sp. NPDC023588]|uniref:hypothetical protein n=1 Tax=Streptomyces sp. NPDC023588 TaxID=3154907 RepID=UPI0033EFABD1